MTEKQKILGGELYDATDPVLVAERLWSCELCARLDLSPHCELFGKLVEAVIQPPFHFDYGTNISMGKGGYLNFNCIILDVVEVQIGDHVLFGPSIQVNTAAHPFGPEIRRSGLKFGKRVVIGSDVWVGGGSIICSGVTIGD